MGQCKMHQHRILGLLEGDEREKFPNMGKEPLTQIQEAQRVPYKINPRIVQSADWRLCRDRSVEDDGCAAP